MIIEIVSSVLLLLGAFMGISSAIGVMRFPDFYTRVHAASISDTLCVGLVILALMLYAGFSLISVKLFLVAILLWYTSPLSGHALVKAAYKAGLEPILDKNLK